MKIRMAMLVLLCGAALAPAQAPTAEFPANPGRPGRAAIYSSDRRFMVSGMTSAENMVMARKLSEGWGGQAAQPDNTKVCFKVLATGASARRAA